MRLDHELDLDGGVHGKFGDADGGAGVQARFTEDLTEELRGSVDHLRLAVEAWRGGDEARNLDDARDAGQAARLRRGGGEGVQGAQPGRLAGFVHADGVADLTPNVQFARFQEGAGLR